MYCNKLHARWSTQPWLATLLSSLIARWWVRLQILASGLSTYDFSVLCAALPRGLIKEKITELIEQTFNREG